MPIWAISAHRPIRRAWSSFVLPCLALNYFGQGALILAHPAAIANPFFLMAPTSLRLPMVLLATAPPSSPARP